MGFWRKVALALTAIAALIEIISVLYSGATIFIQFIVDNISLLWPFGIFAVGLLIGWAARGWWLRPIENPHPLSIPTRTPGCITKGNVVWRGRASLNDEDSIRKVFVRGSPYCPECQTELSVDKGHVDGRGHSDIWRCTNCNHTAPRSREASDEAHKIFKRHIERLVTTSDEPFSLVTIARGLADEGDPAPSGEEVWRRYVELTDEDYITTDCFHA